MNENENTTTQNLWDTVEAVLKGRFIAIQAYLKKQEKSQINNLTLHLKQLEKEEMTTHSSILAWRIPMDRGAWWATVHRVSKESDTTQRLNNNT